MSNNDIIDIDDVEDALKRADELAELTGRNKRDVIADLLDDGQLNYSAGEDAKTKKDILDVANEQAVKIKKLLTTLIPIMLLIAGTGAELTGVVDMTKWGQESVWDDEIPPPYQEPDAPKLWGCTDPNATNYYDWATDNDTSCNYEEPTIWGCTDDKALNYNYDATEDDGSCTYPPPQECDPILYSAYSFYQNNNTTVTVRFDIDCTNAGAPENVTVQWLAWNNGSNHSNSEGPSNWTTADYTIQGEEWDEHNLSLSNFTNGSYDLYLYIMWDDGMASDNYIERKWFNIIIKGGDGE